MAEMVAPVVQLELAAMAEIHMAEQEELPVTVAVADLAATVETQQAHHLAVQAPRAEMEATAVAAATAAMLAAATVANPLVVAAAVPTAVMAVMAAALDMIPKS